MNDIRASENVVELLTRYPVRSRFDARENRLTAAVSAALTLSETLPGWLVQELWPQLEEADTGIWTTDALAWEVVPQKPIFPPGHSRACFLDLEIVASGASTRMWIEAKIASKLSGGNQLAKYADALKRESENHKLLVLLAPERRRQELEKHLPRDRVFPAVFRSWTDVHRVLDAWHRTSMSSQRGRWLVTEVMAYMAEQGYGSVQKLSRKQQQAVDGFEEASNAVWRLFEMANERLQGDWHPKHGPEGRKRWEGWGEQHYRPYRRRANRRGVRREYRSFVLGFEVPLRFGAGVYLRELTEPKKAAVKDYASRDGWHCDVEGRDAWLWRYMTTDDLFSKSHLGAQAEAVAAFARETFEMLESSPPDANRPRSA